MAMMITFHEAMGIRTSNDGPNITGGLMFYHEAFPESGKGGIMGFRGLDWFNHGGSPLDGVIMMFASISKLQLGLE